jgi:hypothetical protein
MISLREERMSDVFQKFHIDGLPVGAVLHHFADVDRGPAHDHPFPFRSIILYGGYVERVFQMDGSSELITRKVGDSFEIAASHIHRIEELPAGDCWTLMLPGPHEQTSGFYEFREDGAYRRFWYENEWAKA